MHGKIANSVTTAVTRSAGVTSYVILRDLTILLFANSAAETFSNYYLIDDSQGHQHYLKWKDTNILIMEIYKYILNITIIVYAKYC